MQAEALKFHATVKDSIQEIAAVEVGARDRLNDLAKGLADGLNQSAGHRLNQLAESKTQIEGLTLALEERDQKTVSYTHLTLPTNRCV